MFSFDTLIKPDRDLNERQNVIWGVLDRWHSLNREDFGRDLKGGTYGIHCFVGRLKPMQENMKEWLEQDGFPASTKFGEITDHTVRHFQSKRWILQPTRKEGQREKEYRAIHFAQMITAYWLRRRGEEVSVLTDIPNWPISQCLNCFGSGSLRSNAPERCGSFRILLAPVAGDSKAGNVASLAQALMSSISGTKALQIEISESTIGAAENSGSFLDQISKFRERCEIDQQTLVQVVTSEQHRDNYFADWENESPRDGVLHVGDYQSPFGFPAHLIVASYSLLLTICAGLDSEGLSPYGFFHYGKPRGCLFDFCADTSDIIIKVKCGDICDDCLNGFGHLFDPTLLRAVANCLDLIRDESRSLNRFTSLASELEEPFGNLRFVLREDSQLSSKTQLEHIRTDLLCLFYVHAIIANSGESTLRLPSESMKLEAWVRRFDGSHMGCIPAQLADALEVWSAMDRQEVRLTASQLVNSLRSLHPHTGFVRIDEIQMKSGKPLVIGKTTRRGSVQPWEQTLESEPGGIGITDTGATYALIEYDSRPTKFVNVDNYIRIAEADGRFSSVLRLSDDSLVDCTSAKRIISSEAFS